MTTGRGRSHWTICGGAHPSTAPRTRPGWTWKGTGSSVTARCWRHSAPVEKTAQTILSSVFWQVDVLVKKRQEMVKALAMASLAICDLCSDVAFLAIWSEGIFLLLLKLLHWASTASFGLAEFEQLRRRCTSLDLRGLRMKSSAPAVKHLLYSKRWWAC